VRPTTSVNPAKTVTESPLVQVIVPLSVAPERSGESVVNGLIVRPVIAAEAAPLIATPIAATAVATINLVIGRMASVPFPPAAD
jgi:hypothetical protein